MRRINLHLPAIAAMLAMALSLAAPAGTNAQERRSVAPLHEGGPLTRLIPGYEFAPVEARALQDDDFDNPGFAWVTRGEASWRRIEGDAGRSCAACHGASSESTRGWSADYPKYDAAAKKVVNLAQRINRCRQEKMNAAPWEHESDEMLAMTAFLGVQSRGIVAKPHHDGPARAAFEAGKTLHTQRMGLLGMSCTGCHDKNYGKSYSSRLISQGHATGFPAYHLDDQSFGSLHRQFDACFARMKAQPFAAGSEEYVALELYLAWRGAGLPLQIPSVRR